MNINYLDIILLIPLLWAAYKGFTKGLIIEVASLLGLIMAVFCSVKFSGFLAEWAKAKFEIETDFLPIVCFIILFFATLLAIMGLAKLLEKVVNIAALGIPNKILGAAFSMVKALFIIGVFIVITETFDKTFDFLPNETKENSMVYQQLLKGIKYIMPFLKEIEIPEHFLELN